MKCPCCDSQMMIEPDGVKRCYCCGTQIGKPKVHLLGEKSK